MEKVLQNIRESIAYPAAWIALMWLVHFYFFVSGSDKSVYALLPRTQEGLWGVPFSPLIHANVEHLASNSLPLLVLMTGVLYFYRQIAGQVIVLSLLSTQILVWSLARQSYHVGASGVVYSLFGFILGMGIFQRNIKSVVLSLLVIAFYGGMIWGVLPGQAGISWESHLIGFICGMLVAFLYRNEVEPDDEAVSGHTPFSFRYQPHDINMDGRDFLLPRNAFAGLRPKYTPIEPEENPDWTHFQQVYEEKYAPPVHSPEPPRNSDKIDILKNTHHSENLENTKKIQDEPKTQLPPPKNDDPWVSTISW